MRTIANQSHPGRAGRTAPTGLWKLRRLLSILMLGAIGCGGSPAPTEPAKPAPLVDLAGTWSGQMIFDRVSEPVTVVIHQDGPRVTGQWSSGTFGDMSLSGIFFDVGSVRQLSVGLTWSRQPTAPCRLPAQFPASANVDKTRIELTHRFACGSPFTGQIFVNFGLALSR